MTTRCQWCGTDPLYVAYHDNEWGLPLHDDRRLLEMLILEGAQAGLSWLTILRKREAYRHAFVNFDCEALASFDDGDVKRFLGDAGIVRNRLKITSAIQNARVALAIKEEVGSLDTFFWQYVDGTPIQNAWTCPADIPAQTARSATISKQHTRRGMTFVGPTICYAFMQSIGMVNDHTTDCFRYEIIRNLGR